ncbi:MAG: PAS domain S-box protein [Candidatus Krumholzibacteriia bacterium]
MQEPIKDPARGNPEDEPRLHSRRPHPGSEEKYRVIFDEVGDGIVLIQSDTGRIVDCNPEFERQTGRSCAQLQRLNIWDLRPAGQRETARAKFGEIRKKGFGGSSELDFERPDGEVRRIEFRSRIVTIDGEKFTASVTRDVTKREKVKDKLRESRARTDAILESALDSIISIDHEDRVLEFNPAAEETFGYAKADVVGRKLTDVIIPERLRDRHRHSLARYCETREPKTLGRRFETTGLRADGTEFPVELAVTCVWKDHQPVFTAFLRDITRRKQTLTALQESEEKYRGIFSEARDGIVLVGDDGTVVDCNPEFEKQTGRSLEELKKTKVWELRPSYQVGRAEALFAKLRKDGSFGAVEQVFEKPDGKTTAVELRGRQIVVGGRSFNQGITRDITDRKRTEEALRERDARLRIMVEQIPAVMWTTDRDLRFTSSTGAGLRALGLKTNEAVGATLYEFFETDDPDFIPIAMHRKALRGESVTYKSNWGGAVFESHTEPLKDENGETVGCIGIALDISERLRAGDYLRRSEERYSKLFHHSNDGVIVYDFDGGIIDVNEKALEQLGYKKAEMLELKIKDLTAPESLPYLRSKFDSLIREGFVRFEAGLKKKNGDVFLGEVSGSIVQIADRQVIQGIVRDVTERKRAEEDIKESHERLRALATRLQTVREEESTNIAREIHDDLGQTLTGLKMDLSWLQRRITELCDHEEGTEIMEMLKSMSSDVDGTIQRVRKISTQLRPVVLDDLGLVGALEWQAQEFANRTGISCEFSTNSTYKLDTQRSTAVFRIFQEILTNVARHSAADRVIVTLNNENSVLVMTVGDNGRGISQDEINSPRALGILGMRERALVCGGGVDIQNANGRGTRVVVRIPMGKS